MRSKRWRDVSLERFEGNELGVECEVKREDSCLRKGKGQLEKRERVEEERRGSARSNQHSA